MVQELNTHTCSPDAIKLRLKDKLVPRELDEWNGGSTLSDCVDWRSKCAALCRCDIRPPSSFSHSCPLRFVDALPLIEPIFGRTFIAIFYVPVGVLTTRKRISLTIARRFVEVVPSFQYRRYKREFRVYRFGRYSDIYAMSLRRS